MCKQMSRRYANKTLLQKQADAYTRWFMGHPLHVPGWEQWKQKTGTWVHVCLHLLVCHLCLGGSPTGKHHPTSVPITQQQGEIWGDHPQVATQPEWMDWLHKQIAQGPSFKSRWHTFVGGASFRQIAVLLKWNGKSDVIPLALVTKAFVIVLSLAVFMESLVTGVSVLRNSQHNTQLTYLPNSCAQQNGEGQLWEIMCHKA